LRKLIEERNGVAGLFEDFASSRGPAAATAARRLRRGLRRWQKALEDDEREMASVGFALVASG